MSYSFNPFYKYICIKHFKSQEREHERRRDESDSLIID
jgi:hypothetical protein